MTSTIGRVYTGRVDLADVNSAWTKIVGLIGHGTRVLEVGCATGYVSEVLVRERGCRVTGIELDPVAAREASHHCETVIVGDVEADALDRVTGCFDVIVFADVLEHLRDPARVLRASRRYLADGGCVVVSLPNVAHWEVRRALLFGRFEYQPTGLLDSGHLRFFTYETAVRLVRGAGFEIEVFDLVFRGPRHWKYERLYRRWERPLHWLVMRYARGLFGYQFIFRLRPLGRRTVG